MTLTATHGEQLLLDRLDRELDVIERGWPMTGPFQRIKPYIINVEEVGLRFRFIICNRESEAWYGDRKAEPGLQQLAILDQPQRGTTVFDLGANAGFMALWYALQVGPEGTVHAFEPSPWYSVICRYQAELNHVQNIHVHPVGVGASRRTIRVPLTSSRTLDVRANEFGSREIEIHDIRDYANLSPQFFKIDIEGAEIEVVRHLREFAELRAIFLELHPIFIREQGEDPIRVIRSIMDFGLTVVPNNVFDVPFTYETIRDDANFYLCTTLEHLEHVKSKIRAPTYNHLTEHARFHVEAGELDLARKYADQAVVQYPLKSLCHRVRGEVLFKQGDIKGAIASAEQAIALTPDDAHVWFFLSWLMGQAEDANRAVNLAGMALQRDRSVAAFHHHLSVQLLKLGRTVEAVAAIEDALQLDPSNTEWLSYRDAILRELDRLKEELSQEPHQPEQSPT